MRLVVSNTGPLLHLGEVQRRNLLNLMGEIHIPQAVDAELSLLDEEWARGRPSWGFSPYCASKLAGTSVLGAAIIAAVAGNMQKCHLRGLRSNPQFQAMIIG